MKRMSALLVIAYKSCNVKLGRIYFNKYQQICWCLYQKRQKECCIKNEFRWPFLSWDKTRETERFTFQWLFPPSVPSYLPLKLNKHYLSINSKLTTNKSYASTKCSLISLNLDHLNTHEAFNFPNFRNSHLRIN